MKTATSVVSIWSCAATVLALAVLGAGGASAGAQPPAADPQDVAEGMRIYRQKADCQSCHGWAGDGRKMDTQMPDGANLRATRLGRAGIINAIKCGRPGRSMPAFDRFAVLGWSLQRHDRGRSEEERTLSAGSGRDAAAARSRDAGRLPLRQGDRQRADGPREVPGVLGIGRRRVCRVPQVAVRLAGSPPS